MRKLIIEKLIGACLVLALAAGMSSVCLAAGSSTTSQNPRVLFLGSYNYEWESVPKHLAGVTDTLDDSVTIDYIFMDTKRLQYEDVKEIVYWDVLSRMESKPFDYVIAADDAALAFVLAYRDDLFAGIPVVFEGINDEEFAYYGGHFEMLRVNGEFAETLRSELSDAEILKLEPFSKFDGDTNEQAVRAIERAYESGRGESFEAYSTQYSPPGKGEYLRISIRRIAEVSGRFLFYAYVDNITAERESVSQLLFLNNMAGKLLYQPDAEAGVYELLNNIMTYFKAKRTYIFEFSGDRRFASNTYELCAEGISAQKENLQSIPVEVFPMWMHAFDEKKYVYIEDVDSLGDDRAMEREILRAQCVKSLIAVPLYRDGKYLGFVGADDSEMRIEQVERFAVLGDYVTVLLTRRDLLRRIEEESRTVKAVMEGIPGGFCRFKLLDNGMLSENYYSQGYLSMLGMSHEQIEEISSGDVLGMVHPDDLSKVKATIADVAAGREFHDLRCRLRSNGGRDYLTVSIHVKAERDEQGNTFVNVYYTDAADLIAAEARQTELETF